MIDLDTLLRPLDGPNPCGSDLSFSPAFDTLRELRREDDPTLSQGEWVTELKRADWPGVARLCESLLRERTKDLRVAGWLAEAATRTQGYRGLADGLALYTALCRQLWDGVHPLPDGADQELRVGSVNWMLSLVGQLSRSIPVLHHGDSTFALRDIEAARLRQLAPSGSEMASGQPNVDDIGRAQRQMPLSEFMPVLDQARRLPAALAEFQAVVDERLGDEGPGFATVRDTVADAVASLERLARDMGAPGSRIEPSASPAADSGAPAQALPTGAPESRAQALAQLRLVAEFFRRTEPHSPVAYLAERAATWGEMPLHVWLRTVMKEQSTLAQLEDLLGVPPQVADGH